jgi:hypothetical protein
LQYLRKNVVDSTSVNQEPTPHKQTIVCLDLSLVKPNRQIDKRLRALPGEVAIESNAIEVASLNLITTQPGETHGK